MRSKTITYFDMEGKENVSKVIKCVQKRLGEGDIKKVLIFAANFNAVTQLIEKVGGLAKIYVVSFPYKQIFYQQNEKQGLEEITPQTSQEHAREMIEKLGAELIQGPLPLDDVIIPKAPDMKLAVIKYTLGIISKSLPLCVDAAVMACDSGKIEPGETIAVMSADTAVVIRASSKVYMFHPERGTRVQEILCKPY